MNKLPTLDIDLFSDEVIANPNPAYQKIREAGPQVWLSQYNMWAIGGYDDVRAALRADSTLLSGKGVAMNDMLNNSGATNSLVSDGDEHRRLRSAVIKPMMPKALAEVRKEVQIRADELIDKLLQQDSFDGMKDFSQYLPVTIVSFLVGLPEEGREQMLDWAAASFNALGPMNERGQASIPSLMQGAQYVAELDRTDLVPDGWAAALYLAADKGDIALDEATRLVFDYIAPSLDTTILGTGHMLYQLGLNPAEFAKIKADVSLIPAAVNEALRIGSPVKAFTRLADADYKHGEIEIPAGDRVVILYGAANLDERKYSEPLTFKVERNPRDHVSYGYGVHRCAGAHLAQLEMECLLDAMVRKVERIEVEAPTPFPSNMLSGFASFEARLS